MRVLSIPVWLSLAATLSAADIYVAGTGDDKNSGSSPEAAFRTLQRAANFAGPGDTVNIMNGEYTKSCAACSVVAITRSGSADAWIVYRALPGHKPRLKFNGWNGVQIKSGASYIEISGLEVQGARSEYTFEYCRAERVNNNPICNGNGISIDGRNDGENKPHHIRLSGNHVWQCPGGGINAIQADYVTIEDNLVHENAWYSRFANSGISVYQAWNFDDKPGPKIMIRRNRVFNNRSLVDWSATNRLSDGNGIIIDDLRNTQNNSRLGVYRGGVRVENNLSFNNGGAGIQAFLCDDVEIVNNTLYKNGQAVGYADILVNQSASVKVVNNIAYSRQAARPIEIIRGVNVLVDYNLTFNGSLPAAGPNDLVGDPLFDAPNTEWGLADFRLRETSPASGSGDNSLAPPDDLSGRSRIGGERVSRGAYEFSSPNVSPLAPVSPKDGRRR